MVYGFQIINNGNGTASQVPLLTTFNGSASVTGPLAASASATLQLGTLNPGGTSLVSPILLGTAQASVLSGTFSQSFSSTIGQTVDLAAGSTIYVMEITVSVQVGTSSTAPPSSMASAFVDPTIIIDPSFAQASDYSIVFAPGVNPAPEPSTIALASLGLLGLVGCGRRKA